METVWVLMDRRKRTPTLLYLCCFSSSEQAIEYAQDRGWGGTGYSVVGLKMEAITCAKE